MPATEQLNIEIMGKLDPSVMQTVNAVKQQLKDIGADARTSSEVMKRTYAQMFDGIGQGAKEQFAQAKDAAGNFQSFMDQVKATFTGVFAADIAKEFFNVAIEGAKKLIDVMKDASKQAADFELQTLELTTDMLMNTRQQKENELYLFGRSLQTPFTVPASLEAERLLSTSFSESDRQKKIDRKSVV